MVATAVLRRFNRTYTQRIGVLDESFLGLGMPLSAARLLYEVGPDGATVRELRGRLGLDSGYLSRLLRRLESRGLVAGEPDPADRRRRLLRLTGRGRDAHAQLERRSEELAASLLEPLTERQRDRLVEALATADLLVRAASVQLREVPDDAPEAQTSLGNYFAEIERRFGRDITPSGPAPLDAFVVATSNGVPVAGGGLHDLEPGVTEVKRMWVDPAWRGAGLGSRLLRHLESLALERGRPVVRLDTNGVLVEAIALYERAGYARIERYIDNPDAELFFEKVVGG